MLPIIKSPELRKLIYEQYCPVVAQLLSISTPFRFILNPGECGLNKTIAIHVA